MDNKDIQQSAVAPADSGVMPRKDLMKNVVAAFTLTLCLQTTTLAEDLRRVTLRDKSFSVVRELESPEQLKAFTDAWSAKVPHSQGERRWEYKIDLEPGERWLYDGEGWLRLLAMKAGQDYKIRDPGAFNELLGIRSASKRVRTP